LWLTVTVVSRDVLLVLGAVLLHYLGAKLVVRPHWTGKVATVLQMICILWALLKLDDGLNPDWLPSWTMGAAVCTAVSGIIYVLEGVRHLSAHPASSAEPGSGGDR
jgi:phosphatidylglycerophosphate synthase